MSIKSNGGRAPVTVRLENFAGASVPRISASTPYWADIVILAEPRSATEKDTASFTINSISPKTGAFTVVFATPCGKPQVTVNVR